jgi:hypothetical protein
MNVFTKVFAGRPIDRRRWARYTAEARGLFFPQVAAVNRIRISLACPHFDALSLRPGFT